MNTKIKNGLPYAASKLAAESRAVWTASGPRDSVSKQIKNESGAYLRGACGIAHNVAAVSAAGWDETVVALLCDLAGKSKVALLE